MADIPPFSSFYVASYTFTDDAVHRVEMDPRIVLTSMNIHVYDQDIYYGNASKTPGIIRANAVAWFDDVRPFDLQFKNLTPGANATVVLIGSIKKC